VIIGAHVGCWGTGAGFFGDYARKMHLVMYDAEYRQIKSVMEKHCGQEGYKVSAVNEGMNKSLWMILGLFTNLLAVIAFLIVRDNPRRVKPQAAQ